MCLWYYTSPFRKKTRTLSDIIWKIALIAHLFHENNLNASSLSKTHSYSPLTLASNHRLLINKDQILPSHWHQHAPTFHHESFNVIRDENTKHVLCHDIYLIMQLLMDKNHVIHSSLFFSGLNPISRLKWRICCVRCTVW